MVGQNSEYFLLSKDEQEMFEGCRYGKIIDDDTGCYIEAYKEIPN